MGVIRKFDGIDRSVVDFYHWGYPDLFTNTTRAVVAEYLVAFALGLEQNRRSTWDGYDLEYGRLKIEVKSTACFVSGKTPTKSNSFDIEERKGSWGRDGELLDSSGISQRFANVYVFAFHAENDGTRADILNVSQWKFFVVPTKWLNEHCKQSQKKISRNKIAQNFEGLSLAQIKQEVERISAELEKG